MALAHVRQVESGWAEQSLFKHLEGTACLSAQFAGRFGNADWGGVAGCLHDVGKYNPVWQQYLKSKSGYDPSAHLEGLPGKVDHSTAGALLAVETFGPAGQILAYLIAGHHAGLPDWTHEMAIGGALAKRLEEKSHLRVVQEGLIPKELLTLTPPNSLPCIDAPEHCHLWIRMLFSCLVDADFLDTEAFMSPEAASLRGNPGNALLNLKGRLDAFMAKKQQEAPNTLVNQVRAGVLSACREGGIKEPGLFSLTVPTGGGKTLASLAFALEHAAAHGKDRIIVVVPYTSIIEQTAQVFREVFGEGVVLEHHSNLDPELESTQARLASENWDAPIVVTTNVQFFESLFAARSSRCRKLHNIANSVVILDEAQMLPPVFLRPILNTLKGLTHAFHVSVVLCTATQPALVGRIGSQQAAFYGFDPNQVRELMPNPGELTKALKRVALRPQHPLLSPVAWQDLAVELSNHRQVLCIVNTRRDCRELFALMPPGTVHLSALMCSEHRSQVIQAIKEALVAGGSIRVISTQLVEAGVDLDFPVVYRALAGLDSIAQAAGRCNREGKLNAMGQLGEVVYFKAPHDAPPGLLLKGQQASEEMLRTASELARSLEPEAFVRYFQLFFSKVISFDEKDMKGLLETSAQSCQFQFRTASSRFHLIDDQAQKALIVLYPPKKAEIEELLETMRFAGPSRERTRKLQRYSVTLPERDFKALQDRGEVLDYGGIWAQAVDGLYDPILGLCPKGAPWNPDTYVL